mmetsp:Transcript_59251/g.139740  ORF Transcript_59251/g.139740 Transcript_59251/m.139740 type:complete len:404 (-) Transcript_59251:1158-2369(-)
MAHWRRGRCEIDLARTGLAGHLHDLLRGGAAHDGIVHQQHIAAFELHADGIELLAHALLAGALPRHDEGAADVAVLDEAFAVGLADAVGQLHGRRAAAFRDRDDDVDLVGRHGGDDALRQRLAHVQACLIDRDAVHHRVRAGQVDELEHAGVQRRVVVALLGVHLAGHVNEQRLAGRQVTLQFVACSFQRHAFAGDHELAIGRLAEAQRPDAEGVAEGQQALAGDQRNDGIAALDALLHGAHGVEDFLGRQRQVACGQLQLVGQHVDQHLGVALGVDVTAVDVEQLVLQRMGIRQVAVVHQHDAERRVDVEGLSLFLAVGIAGGRVAHLAEADRARQRAHVAGAEDVAHHAARLVHEALLALHRDDTGRILTAMLQQQQRVIQELVDGRSSEGADDAAHGRSP